VKLVFCSWPHHLQHNSEQRQNTLQRTISGLARTASEGSTAAGSLADAGGSVGWEWMGPAASCAWDVINIFNGEWIEVEGDTPTNGDEILGVKVDTCGGAWEPLSWLP